MVQSYLQKGLKKFWVRIQLLLRVTCIHQLKMTRTITATQNTAIQLIIRQSESLKQNSVLQWQKSQSVDTPTTLTDNKEALKRTNLITLKTWSKWVIFKALQNEKRKRPQSFIAKLIFIPTKTKVDLMMN